MKNKLAYKCLHTSNCFTFLLCVALIFIVGACNHVQNSQAVLPKVCITQIASHTSLDEVRRGIIDSLSHNGYRDKETIEIVFRNANGDSSLTLPIAQDFVRLRASVIVPITTPSALACAKSTDSIPIVFGGVTDPVKVGLVADMNSPGKNITGTSDQWPYEEQLEFFRKILPQAKTIGMLYMAGDDVAFAAVNGIRKHAAGLGFTLRAQPVSNAADIYPSTVALLKDVDVAYAGMDNLIADNLESILKAAHEAGKPVLSGDAQSVARGALGTWAIGMYELGRETGDMVALVLKGEAPGQMPVQVVSKGNPVVNKALAKKFNIDMELLNKLNVEFVEDNN